jgi:hypothetical protein
MRRCWTAQHAEPTSLQADCKRGGNLVFAFAAPKQCEAHVPAMLPQAISGVAGLWVGSLEAMGRSTRPINWATGAELTAQTYVLTGSKQRRFEAER